MDVTGYYQTGGAGARGPSAWDVIPSGQTVTGEIVYDTHESSSTLTDSFVVPLPGIAPTALTGTTVNFDGFSGASDADATCVGSLGAPTAPPGNVCIYLDISDGITIATLSGSVLNLSTRSFLVNWNPAGVDNGDEFLYAPWAYTAP